MEMIVYYMSAGPLHGRGNQDQNKENDPWWTQKYTVLDWWTLHVNTKNMIDFFCQSHSMLVLRKIYIFLNMCIIYFEIIM